MSYSYYPAGMSREDLIYVGEIEDPDAAPEWFSELLNLEGEDADVIEADLWEECRADGEDFNDLSGETFNNAFSKSWAYNWLRDNHPEAAAPTEYTNQKGELMRWSGYYEDWLSVKNPMVRNADRKYVPANEKLVWCPAF